MIGSNVEGREVRVKKAGARHPRRARRPGGRRSLLARLVAAVLPLPLLLSGCSSPPASSRASGPEEIGPVISQVPAEIVNVRDVMITPTDAAARGASGPGSRVGKAAALGAISGSPVPLVRVVSSVMSDAGHGKLDNRMGEEITVRVKGGGTMILVQDRSDPPMSPGELVTVVTSGAPGSPEKIRVVREVDDPSAPIGARR